jgi:hypothetical protein
VNGFVVFFDDTPEQAFYISGDTVWHDGIREIARRYAIPVARFHLGAARVSAVGRAVFHKCRDCAHSFRGPGAFSSKAGMKSRESLPIRVLKIEFGGRNVGVRFSSILKNH